MLIYGRHKNSSNDVVVIYEDTKGKTKYKNCRSTTDEVFSYNGFNHYIILINRFYENSYYCEETIYKLYHSRFNNKKKVDFLEILDKLIKLFD